MALSVPSLGLQSASTAARAHRTTELELVLAAEGGDARACEQLVETFLPLIGSVARLYSGSRSVSQEELMQEGVCGLLRALKRYDAEFGTPFWAYASWWVRQAMQQLTAQVKRPSVLSDRALRRLARLKDAQQELVQAHAREPSTADLIETTGFTREQVDQLLAIDRTPRGLEERSAGEDGGPGTIGELVADPFAEDEYERVIDGIEIERLHDLSAKLDERERNIVFSHYGLGRPAQTLREIASPLGLSVERIRQIEQRALDKLRAACGLHRSTASSHGVD